MSENHSRFDLEDVEVIEKTSLYSGFFKLNRYTFRHKLFAGGWSEGITRELLERGSAVALLPYDPKRDKVVLIEQFRIGALDSPYSPWLLEVVAGIMDHDETPEELARREAEEEAGLTLGRCDRVMSYLVSPGGTSERIDVYVGETDSDAVVEGVFGLPHEGEDIRVQVVDRQTAYEWLQQGRVENATAVIALQWLQLNYQELQARWQE
ncbi:ADP-ribose diphosphatase [Dongshaea marina]|uniref:ADP-ribose diphosphatase n=1 Tax=Dongshaea marina TaxID=2047966 RepID=UPI00190274BE|nr:ADP-ribose diphosphatase [Dongshaea marina]